MSVLSSVVDIIKRHFLSGVLVVVPIILTYLVLSFLFSAIDGILQPLIFQLLGYYLPGLGVVTTLLLIILAGFFTRNIVGARIIGMGDRLLARVPFIRPIYLSAKQVLTAVAGKSEATFKEVCLIEYPRAGVWVLGFITGYSRLDLNGVQGRFASVFVGSSPTPITGWTVLVPESEVVIVNMSVEEGIKFLVSGGVIAPELIRLKDTLVTQQSGEELK